MIGITLAVLMDRGTMTLIFSKRTIIKRIKENPIWNRVSLIIVIVLYIFLFVLILKYLINKNPPLAKSVSIVPIQLEIPNVSHSKPIFRVYYPSNDDKKALLLAKYLVASLADLHVFSSIEITYYLGIAERDRRIRTHNKDNKFDLLLMKPDILKRLNLQDIYYAPLADYASYDVFLIAKNTQPSLEDSYFKGKRLGLLARPVSESGHKLPKKVIMKKVSKESLPKFIAKYSSHNQLRVALANDEIDLIGSYWSKNNRKKYPTWRTLKIARVAKGSTWFLDGHDKITKNIECAIAKSLKKLAKQNKNKYWKNISIMAECKMR